MVSDFIKQDALRAFDILKSGGIAIIPMDVGYTCAGGSGKALKKIFDTKQRQASKRNAMVGDLAIAKELYELSERGWDVINTIIEIHEVPFE